MESRTTGSITPTYCHQYKRLAVTAAMNLTKRKNRLTAELSVFLSQILKGCDSSTSIEKKYFICFILKRGLFPERVVANKSLGYKHTFFKTENDTL